MGEVKWIKLSVGLFNNRKIKQIRKLPEGDAIIGVWLQILCLAGQTNDNGMVYFSRDIPYTEEMLATEFDRHTNIIKISLRTLESFRMIEIVDDILLVSNWAKYQSTDKLKTIKEQNKARQQRFRDRQKQEQLTDSNVTVTLRNDTDIDIDKDKERDKDYIQPAPAEPTPQETARQSIFDHWNNQGIIKHRTLTDKFKRTINGALKAYSVDEIKQAISNYATILEGEQYYFSYKWTLQEFLQRGLDKFLDWDVCSVNYAIRGDPHKEASTDLDSKYADIYMT